MQLLRKEQLNGELNMQAIEFEADVLDDVIHIPRRFKRSTRNHHFKVIMMPQGESTDNKSFDPQKFCGVSTASKKEIDAYLIAVKKEWD